MEFYNPIHDMTDLIGRWEGNMEKDENKSASSIIFRHHGSDIIQYKQIVNFRNKERILETGFFFFDKLKEELKHIVFNEEGYIEVNSLISSKKTKLLKMTSSFDSGYNLPPNMKIRRDFKLKINEKELEISLKMGKEANLISEAIYRKKEK
ncbi:MAG: FABP family protein [Candidatus Heimdallarchaeota archaeon]|nr:FABP family protein [Candidatus Heimdallarchaeota archaeon]MCK4876131.1 FABP family protein [Candidatus Heimdallarchaeota archaeon]